MTSEEVKNVTFERGMRGYRVDDVNDFLKKTAAAMDDLELERDEAIERQAEIEEKLYILAQKVEEYRGQEDTLKTALINAQRMGETVVYEAKQKADHLLRDATGKAELLRQQAETESANEQLILEKLQAEVTRFKATVLSLYKQHIESLSALDSPVARVDEFLEEMNFEPILQEEEELFDEQEEFAQDDDETEYDEIQEEAYEEEANVSFEEQPQANKDARGEETAARMGLFEGVPIDL